MPSLRRTCPTVVASTGTVSPPGPTGFSGPSIYTWFPKVRSPWNSELTATTRFLLSALLAACAVSIAGIISFVGLIIPNIAKLLIGNDYRYSIPASVFLGIIFLAVSDVIARVVIAPAELPVGIVTSFLGAPVFIWLIMRNKTV